MENLTATEARIGDTTFYFSRLGAVKGFRVMELIRQELGKRIKDDEASVVDVMSDIALQASGGTEEETPAIPGPEKNISMESDSELQALADAASNNAEADGESTSVTNDQEARRLAMALMRIARLIMGFDVNFVAALQKVMFTTVQYTTELNPTQKRPLDSKPNFDFAFGNLPPVSLYEVLVRSLAVNFFDSWHALLNLLGRGEAQPDTSQ